MSKAKTKAEKCGYFLRCERDVVATILHPILGAFRCCKKCRALYVRLGKEKRS